jgi:hypothetical protein
LKAQAKETDGTLPIRLAGNRPYIGAMRLLREVGFDGTEALDIEAAAYNSHGFEFKLR